MLGFLMKKALICRLVWSVSWCLITFRIMVTSIYYRQFDCRKDNEIDAKNRKHDKMK